MPRPIRKRTTPALVKKPSRRLSALSTNVSTIVEEKSGDMDFDINVFSPSEDKENVVPLTPRKQTSPFKAMAVSTPLAKPKSPVKIHTDDDDDPFGLSVVVKPGRKLQSPAHKLRQQKIEEMMNQIPSFDGSSSPTTPAVLSKTPTPKKSPRKPLKPLTTEELLARMPKASSSSAFQPYVDEAENESHSSSAAEDDDSDVDYGKTTRRKRRTRAAAKKEKQVRAKRAKKMEQEEDQADGAELADIQVTPFFKKMGQVVDDFELEEEIASSP